MYIKSPIEKLDYGKDWVDFLLPGETIVSVEASSTPEGLTLQNAGISGTITVVWITGGVMGKSYRITFIIHTSTGAIAADSLWIKIGVK